jgi:hypothetical protein
MKRFLEACSEHVPVLILAVMLGAGFFVSPSDLPAHSSCIFKHIFLIDCPGCGLTRAFLSIPQGEFRAAFAYNAASLPLYLFFAAALIRRSGVPLPGFVSRFAMGRFTAAYSAGIVILLAVQWGVKTAGYFTDHPFSTYVMTLRSRPFSEIALVHALWQAI